MSRLHSLNSTCTAICISLATLSSAAAQQEISQMPIIVTNVVHDYPAPRSAPFGVAPRPQVGIAVASTPVQAIQQPLPQELTDTILAWNTTVNEVHVPAATMFGKFAFIFTNVSTAPVTIISAPPSCGCTTANLDLPKLVQPQEQVGFEVMMNVGGKHGTVEKTVTINTDKGSRVLIVRTIIAEDVTNLSEDDRKNNMSMAVADRQAVFRDDCARCHVEPTRGKMGKELFAAACGICHESAHRASMVPDLHAMNHEAGAAFWMTWITYGKPNSLMPAFSQAQDGILTPEQITSLVDYLVVTIPGKIPTAESKTEATAKPGPFSTN